MVSGKGMGTLSARCDGLVLARFILSLHGELFSFFLSLLLHPSFPALIHLLKKESNHSYQKRPKVNGNIGKYKCDHNPAKIVFKVEICHVINEWNLQIGKEEDSHFIVDLEVDRIGTDKWFHSY